MKDLTHSELCQLTAKKFMKEIALNEDLFHNDNSSTPCDECLKELKTYIDSITN